MTDVDFGSSSARDLLGLWAAAALELKRRGVVRHHTMIVGETAELLVCEHFGGELAGSSQKGWDVVTPDGQLVQVKGMWRTTHGRTDLSAIRSVDYDVVVAVIFDAGFGLEAAYRIPREVIERRFARSSMTNSRKAIMSARLLAEEPDIEQLDMSAAYARVLLSTGPLHGGG